jgi:hypothetical protein
VCVCGVCLGCVGVCWVVCMLLCYGGLPGSKRGSSKKTAPNAHGTILHP